MKVNTYLYYNGNCEAAFKYYEKVLGAKIEVMMPHEGTPAEAHTPAEWQKKILHGRITIDGEMIMASDAPPGNYHKPQGFSVALHVDELADAERKFKALADGGTVTMAFAPTFFSKGFGTCVDQFGIPWLVICPMDM